ncbi:centromeric protein E [Marchantia polymorpha subsp. ruderalis]
MASSSSKARTSSPFRFRKQPASVNGKLPGLSQIHTPSHSSSSSQTGPSPANKTPSIVGRSLTPNRGRTAVTNTPSITPQKYRVSANSPAASAASPITPTSERADFLNRAKENVSVTVRFRPLNSREIQRGDEVAWYADGDTTVRSEYNAATAYAFDRVFGPATTTRGVYDIAAQHVVGGAMEGVNGTVFAYGVTSSGKTHTMHGDQKSPGIIPLAVKDVFSIIQETPGREFLLRVSYLEIYNEVINDLLDPAGQNLRVREDAQGTYVEGIKEEVVLSPAHALSLIAAGEEHRHVGSNNFNLLSSRSHTIFTLTVESSARGEGYNEEDVTLSQLNLIDLAGSESSKTETTGLRRKEGSYINKSLLTLGTVIAKLSEGKASHIPYRDSKLTRLLQSSLSGHGRISLICTITPASSNNEETHNTLKFAHRAKRVEIHAAPNRILDEKSLIKKYQKEISSLKQELEQLKRGILEKPYMVTTSQEDLLTLRQQLEAGQVKMQSRLEEEEQAKAALMGRIQRLTKLILVSTKNTIPHASLLPDKPAHRRRHSFGEEELAYLPDKRRELVHFDEEDESGTGNADHESGEGKGDNNSLEDHNKEEKKTKKRGMLAWFKLRRNENLHVSPATSLDNEHSPIVSPGSVNAAFEQSFDFKGSRRKSISRRVDEMLPAADSFPEPTQAGELFSATVRGRRPPPTGTTMADQMDLLREQVKMIAGEVALCTSSLKRLSEQAVNNPDDVQVQSQMQKLKDEIQEKRRQMKLLEQRIGSADALPSTASPFEMSQTISKLMSQLNEKAFELEIKTADNRILQEQLQSKAVEINEMQDTIHSLRSQLSTALEKKVHHHRNGDSLVDNTEEAGGWLNTGGLSGELRFVETGSDAGRPTSRGSSRDFNDSECASLQSQILQQATEIDKLKQERTRWQEEREKLKQEKIRLQEEKGCLQIEGQQLADEAAFARELASRAVVELKNLADEVTKLSYQNAKLSNDLSTAQELAFAARLSPKLKHTANKECQTDQEIPLDIPLIDTDRNMNGFLDDIGSWTLDSEPLLDDIKRELKASKEKEAALELALLEKERKEAELVKKVNEAKQHETDLENDLAGMWVLVAQLKKEKEMTDLRQGPLQDDLRSKGGDDFLLLTNDTNVTKVKDGQDQPSTLEDIKSQLEQERQRAQELETIVLHLKSEELDDLDIDSLYELQNVHVEALTKLCQAKGRQQKKLEKERLERERVEKERERERERELQAKMQLDIVPIKGVEQELHEEERNVCKVCFESPTAAVLLPCRHFCLCKTCAVACTECPLCRSAITDRIVTYTS